MRFLHKLKNKITDISGYWIYKKKHLPSGIDLYFDFENKFKDYEIKMIFDVGGNVGQSIIEFKKHFPKATIYSFEPVKSTFDKLKVESSKFANVFCNHFGMGSSPGQLEIFIEQFSFWNSILPVDGGAQGASKETINIRTVDDFMNENKIIEIDLLKTDTEGFDLEVLKGATNALRNKSINFIFSEVGFHPNDKRHTNLHELIVYLREYDYYFYSLYNLQGEGTSWMYANALFVKRMQ
ncbi:MAG: FkbM family methyltransferase [Cytophagales bacterium]|nr:FkbM family methyltransferase [Cytophagales bacterium]